jgi:hypothetical protein
LLNIKCKELIDGTFETENFTGRKKSWFGHPQGRPLYQPSVDPQLMDACGLEFARLFAGIGAQKVLTARFRASPRVDDRQVSESSGGLCPQNQANNHAPTRFT